MVNLVFRLVLVKLKKGIYFFVEMYNRIWIFSLERESNRFLLFQDLLNSSKAKPIRNFFSSKGLVVKQVFKRNKFETALMIDYVSMAPRYLKITNCYQIKWDIFEIRIDLSYIQILWLYVFNIYKNFVEN